MTTRTCPACTNGRTKHYRSGYSPEARRCTVCKGTARVTAAAWLHVFFAAPRGPMTRATAIKLACNALGLNRDGSEICEMEILRNGVGGLVADLRAQGYGDVADRLKSAYLARRTCETAEGFEGFIAEVEAARAEITASGAA
jgi:hypothetical protein